MITEQRKREIEAITTRFISGADLGVLAEMVEFSAEEKEYSAVVGYKLAKLHGAVR